MDLLKLMIKILDTGKALAINTLFRFSKLWVTFKAYPGVVKVPIRIFADINMFFQSHPR